MGSETAAILTAEQVQAIRSAWNSPNMSDICDSHEALRAALAAAEQGRQWQPMETAPKDGNDVLVVTHHCIVRVAFWDTARGGRWSLWPGRERSEPTHWQPLPDPPTAASAARLPHGRTPATPDTSTPAS